MCNYAQQLFSDYTFDFDAPVLKRCVDLLNVPEEDEIITATQVSEDALRAGDLNAMRHLFRFGFVYIGDYQYKLIGVEGKLI